MLRQKPLRMTVVKEWLFALASSKSNRTVRSSRQNDFVGSTRARPVLYGMLFQACFTIAVNTTATITAAAGTRPKQNISIALHSRHTVAADDGSRTDEIACLQKLLPVEK
jgi:hypothetical protein